MILLCPGFLSGMFMRNSQFPLVKHIVIILSYSVIEACALFRYYISYPNLLCLILFWISGLFYILSISEQVLSPLLVILGLPLHKLNPTLCSQGYQFQVCKSAVC